MDEWPAPASRLLLLSDASQAVALEQVFPDGLKKQLQDVFLTEVVRSSKRIVAGAAAFQLGVDGGNRVEGDGGAPEVVKCHHESDGPPLRSHIFDMKNDQSEGAGGPGAGVDFYSAYAEHTIEAILGLVETFPTLNMHNRVAILAPNETFRDALHQELQARLDASPAADGRGKSDRVSVGGRFKLVSANHAAACMNVGAGTTGSSGGGGKARISN